MAPKVATKSSDPSILETLTIYSNVNPSDTVSLADGILELNYIESIMNDTIKVNLSFVDTGASINDKTVIEGLPLVGQEKVVLKFRDNNKNVLGDKPELVLYVNKITPAVDLSLIHI